MSGTNQQRLIPANTTLLQPGTQYFRISDAINNGAQVADLQAKVISLQNQINTINARLAAANIP